MPVERPDSVPLTKEAISALEKEQRQHAARKEHKAAAATERAIRRRAEKLTKPTTDPAISTSERAATAEAADAAAAVREIRQRAEAIAAEASPAEVSRSVVDPRAIRARAAKSGVVLLGAE